MPASVPDHASGLLLRVAAGDEDAFHELYDLTAPTVYGLALRIIGDEHMSQDVLQEVFAHVWEQAKRFDPTRGTARAWVTTMAHRRAVDRVRREQTDRQRFANWATASHEPAHDHVAAVVDLRAEHRAVRHALSALTSRQREALQLVYFGGMTHAEVAAHLDLPLGTAKTRIRDALKALRQHLEAPQ